MPKIGMEPIRRRALVKATITEIGRVGSLDVTVGKIAHRAGMSTALAHHYFGRKDQLLLAAMRYILATYSRNVRTALAQAETPRARLEAIISASFEAENFRPATIAAWLNFYVQAQRVAGAKRLLHIYQARLHSNLVSALRPLVGGRAPDVAQDLAAMIDGLYIRHALAGKRPDGNAAAARVLAQLDAVVLMATTDDGADLASHLDAHDAG